MLTPFRLIFLLCVAAIGPYLASETSFGRSTFTRLTNMLRPSHKQRPVDNNGTLLTSASGSRWGSGSQSATSQSYGSQSYGSQSYGSLSGAQQGQSRSATSSSGESSGGWLSSLWGGSGSSKSQPSNPTDATYANHSHYEVEKLRQLSPEQYRYDDHFVRKLGGVPAEQPGPSLVGAKIPDLRSVMRFDISPDWVIQRFARVSTVLADLSLKGLRVPVVTGTQADDLAGTLTYYFDKGGELQRLTLHGFTGSPQKLVTAMTSHYSLTHEPTLEAGVYTKRWNGQPIHFLRLTHAPVVYSNAVHQKYTVFLELNHPNLAYGISNEARRIVTADRATGRW